jgi:uncharacterized membrane protein
VNTPGLFVIGAIVTLVVLAAIAILIYGAVLDGRDQREQDDAVRPAEAEAEAAVPQS